MADIYISAYDWDVQDFDDPTHSTYPSQIIGTYPLDPGDDTYIQARASNFFSSSLPQHGIAFGFWRPVDVTSNPNPRVRVRMSGFLDGSGYQVYPSVSLFPLGNQYDPAAQIGSDVFPYLTDWRSPDAAGSYINDEIQQADFNLSSAAQAVLRDQGLAIRVSSNGSASSDTADWELLMRVREMRIALAALSTQAPPCQVYPRDDDQGAGVAAVWPPPSSGLPGSYY
jgi:hypothetical protein